jgi:peptidoglycan hydrolase-like protein with peptidoglycan-binding domain
MFFYPQKEFVKDIQGVFNLEADGIAGPETLLETITLSEVLNRKHPAIYLVQRRLYVLGYTEIGKINGIADGKFTSAVKHFQADNGCFISGEITARDKTWKKLLGME